MGAGAEFMEMKFLCDKYLSELSLSRIIAWQ